MRDTALPYLYSVQQKRVVMPSFEIDPDELAERVEADLRRQKAITRTVFAFVSLGMFVLFNVLAWSFASRVEVLGEAREAILGALILMDVGWGVTVLYHLIGVMLENPAVDRQSRARIASRLVGEQVFQQVTTRKAKRRDTSDELDEDEPMTIGPDGELLSEREARARRR